MLKTTQTDADDIKDRSMNIPNSTRQCDANQV